MCPVQNVTYLSGRSQCLVADLIPDGSGRVTKKRPAGWSMLKPARRPHTTRAHRHGRPCRASPRSNSRGCENYRLARRRALSPETYPVRYRPVQSPSGHRDWKVPKLGLLCPTNRSWAPSASDACCCEVFNDPNATFVTQVSCLPMRNGPIPRCPNHPQTREAFERWYRVAKDRLLSEAGFPPYDPRPRFKCSSATTINGDIMRASTSSTCRCLLRAGNDSTPGTEGNRMASRLSMARSLRQSRHLTEEPDEPDAPSSNGIRCHNESDN